MAIKEPYPELETLMEQMGQAGRHLAEISASEGAAGNISVYIGWDIDPTTHFPNTETIQLPEAAPELAGKGFLVTGSGRRLRECGDDPEANMGFVRVDEGGATGTLFTSPRHLFAKPTSEFNSHLAVHRDQILRTGTNFHALIHAQPVYLVYLSHIHRYQDLRYLNRHILRWQPELIVQLPQGICYLPFMVPGFPQLMAANVKALRDYRVVLWAKHGVMARSDQSVKRAADRVEYAETGAHYEYLNLCNSGLADGLSDADVRAICDSLGIEQSVF